MYDLRFRVVRFRISGGCYETVYTNLDSETFPIGTIKELYRLRSGIETSFRELIAFFKIKAHIHVSGTTLNSQKARHSERRVESHWEEHPMTLP